MGEKLTADEFFATVQPGDQFRYHAVNPRELPPPSCLMTATATPASGSEDVVFRFPPAYLTQFGVTTAAFNLAEHAGINDRFEIVNDGASPGDA